MSINPTHNQQRRIAEAVRTACIRTFIAAYEQAASDGLCCEGAWEVALDALRALDLERLTTELPPPQPDELH